MGRECVSDFRLVPQPPSAIVDLSDRARQGNEAAPSIATVIDYALATVIARKNQIARLKDQVRAMFDLDLPLLPRRVSADRVALAWAGSGHWLAMSQGIDGSTFEARLRANLDGTTSVSDQSDARVVFRIAGASARKVLAKGVPIDLHPRAFRPGDTAVTMVSHMGAHIWQIDSVPTFELAVLRSYSASFLDWFTIAAGEFGRR
jgi:methylglutamate dehydrogenase subunit D